MNMHGIMTPAVAEDDDGAGSRPRQLADRLVRRLWQSRVFLLVVGLPVLLLGGYLYLIASNQYQSEAHFIVRSQNVAEAPGTGISLALSMVTGSTAAQNESMSVADYLTSHDAVEALRRQAQLVERMHRSEIDPFSRLSKADPTPEQLLKYYRKQVKVHMSTETGITTLEVRSFRPEDSYVIVRKLLELGEQRVNVLNQRSYNDSIAMSRHQLETAEGDLAVVQSQLTHFRQTRGDIDPQASGQAQIGLVSTLSAQLSAARAQQATMGRMISSSSPQYQAVAARVNALAAQVSAQSGRLTGSGQAIAADIGGYQDLVVRRDFLAKRYEAAAASLDKARDQAVRQQLYLVRVVDANMPVKSQYPERGRVLGTVVVALLLAYSIGWLIVAGVKEHAA